MHEIMRRHMDTVDALANGDDQYFALLKEMRRLEKQYNEVLHTLTADQQNIICDFVSLCEEMSWRKLELACTHMRFPK